MIINYFELLENLKEYRELIRECLEDKDSNKEGEIKDKINKVKEMNPSDIGFLSSLLYNISKEYFIQKDYFGICH